MTTKTVQLHNKIVKFHLRRSSRAKRMRLAVYCNGNFVVTIPSGMHESSVKYYLIQKSNWVLTKLDFFKKIVKSKTFKIAEKDYEKYKEQAFQIVRSRLDYFNKQFGCKYNKISIKNQKTRWGSCSKKRNLNFNFKIALLQPDIRDYIIVHELCHLKEFSHSKKYWNLVKNILPNYKILIEKLHLDGLQLA